MSGTAFEDFGKPAGQDDVARTDDVLSELFVETEPTRSFLDGSAHYPVIYGPKGSGKSLLLFKKALSIRQNHGVLCYPTRPYAYAPSPTYGDAERWVTVLSPTFSPDGRNTDSGWKSLWYWALLSTVVYWWRKTIDDEPISWRQKTEHEPGLREFRRELEALGTPFTDNPYDLISEKIVELADKQSQRHGRALMPSSARHAALVRRYANHFPPTYLFLDNQDDLYEESPEYWIASGAGCFRALRDVRQLTDGRVHVFMTLRSDVVGALQRSEQFPVWSSDLFPISWQDDDLLRVLSARARRLREGLLRAPELIARSPLAAFFGREFVDPATGNTMIRIPSAETHRRRSVLSIESYLLRHTLRRPRDLIVLGNAIIEQRRVASIASDPVDVVRRSVDEAAARTIGLGYLAEIAKQWPWHELPNGSIEGFVSSLPKNVLARREATAITANYAKRLGAVINGIEPFIHLARLGLVGWPTQDYTRSRGEVQHFVKPGESLRDFPDRAHHFLVHPALYGPPFRIRVVRGTLVEPGGPFQRRLSGSYASVFVSFGSSDEETAIRLHESLQGIGVNCWCHPCSATADVPAWEEIQTKIDSSDVMVCLASVQSISQEGFLDEVIARAARKILVVALDKDWRKVTGESGDKLTRARDLLLQANPIDASDRDVEEWAEDVAKLLARKGNGRARTSDHKRAGESAPAGETPRRP